MFVLLELVWILQRYQSVFVPCSIIVPLGLGRQCQPCNRSAQRQVEWLCQYIKSLFAWLMTEWVASQPFPKDIQEICGKAWMQSGFVAILLSFWPCESVRVAVLFATILIPNIERLEEYFHVYFFLLSVICWLKKMKLKYLLSWYNCCNFLNYQEHPERSSFCESK